MVDQVVIDPHIGWAIICCVLALVVAVIQLGINRHQGRPPEDKGPPDFPTFPSF